MKRLISLLSVLLFMAVAAPVFALDADPHQRDTRDARATIVDEVIRMSQAGVAEDAMLAYVQKNRDRFDITADDMIALTDARVPKAVIRALVDQADTYNGDDGRGRREVVRTVVQPSLYVGAPWFYDPFYYDPWWYAPRLSLSFGFGHYGYRGFRHGGFHHRR